MKAFAAFLVLAASAAQAQDPHAGHTMAPVAVPSEMDMDVSAADPAASAGATTIGSAPAPAPPADYWADRFFPPAEMAATRRALWREHDGGSFMQVMFNLAEVQIHDGSTGYRWDADAWIGGDINRLVIKSEGEGAAVVESAEVQALYSRAIDPYWNLQAGVRHDFKPGPAATYATIGIEGLAPYWFDIVAAAFVSGDGDVLGRFEVSYDQRITQRLILQPRVELNLSAQDMPTQGIGAGLSNAELGLRLRYEISRKFAPYIGISFDGKTGTTASYARAAGEAPTTTSLVIGVRSWF